MSLLDVFSSKEGRSQSRNASAYSRAYKRPCTEGFSEAEKDILKQDFGKNLTLNLVENEVKRIGNESLLITSASDLAMVTKTSKPEITSQVNQLGEDCIAFIDEKNDFYTLPTAELSKSEAIAVMKLRKFLTSELAIQFNVRYVTRSVFESFRDSKLPGAVKEGEKEGTLTVEELLARAVETGATDVHLHNIGSKSEVFFRIFGEFVRSEDFAIEYGHKIVNAVFQIYCKKPLSNESAKDGRFTWIDRNQKKWLVRVSYGQSPDNKVESLALRLRDMKDVPSLDALGYHASQRQAFKLALGNKGVILIVGAVNSGKSTTQTAIMAGLPKNQKIVEISDQIEVELNHVVQLQLPTTGTDDDLEKSKAELIKLPTRHDVDYIAINEIRDQTTASMLASMMMQGTQGITSIHGSRWGDAINRLLPGELGVSPKVLFSDSFFNAIVFQTLTGVLCRECKLRHCDDPFWDDHYRRGFGPDAAESLRFKNPDGCETCNFSGIEGLTLVAEVIRIDATNRRLLEDPSDSGPMTRWMADNGVLNVHQHAHMKIVAGLIDPVQVRPKIGDFSSHNLGVDWRL